MKGYQLEYGSRGIVREGDYFKLQREFETWMREVKEIPDFLGPKWELMEHFATFCEDFNTCTFPHEKYYDLDKWEAEQAEKKKKKLLKKMKESGALAKMKEQEEKIAASEKKMKERIAAAHADLKRLDPAKIAAMKSQNMLFSQMQMAFKSGNTTEAERIKKLLAPDTAEELWKKAQRGY